MTSTDQPLPGTEKIRRALPAELEIALRRVRSAHRDLQQVAAWIEEGHEGWHNEPDRLEMMLQQLRAASADLDRATEGVVVRARSLDLSWTFIGDALRVTRQAAQKRFRRLTVKPAGARN